MDLRKGSTEANKGAGVKNDAAMEELAQRDLGLLDVNNNEWISQMGLNPDRMPVSSKEADIAEQILADEMKSMSIAEAERATFKVHGLEFKGNSEDEQAINQKLEDLEKGLQGISPSHKQAYEKAKYENEQYVSNREFRLMFLRCEEYNIQLATQRIVKHFDVKRELFGEHLLGRNVRISDFSKEDVFVLEAGQFQILPDRDVAGRLVVISNQASRPPDASDLSLKRALFYWMCTLSRYEDVQLQGFVMIMYISPNLAKTETLYSFGRIQQVRQGCPRKLASVHICFESILYRPLVAGIKLCGRKELRSLIRSHCGNMEKNKFDLQTFGIFTDNLPIDLNGRAKVDYHREWLKGQRAREENAVDSSDMIVPRRFDCLFGRGQHTRNHTGNVRAAHIVDMHREQYEKSSKLEKTAIAQRIVGMIGESHGRFLKWESDGWVVVDAQTARNKISHMYRNTRNKKATAGAKAVAPITSDDIASLSSHIIDSTINSRKHSEIL